MDTRKLKHFLALCEHGSFHRAARAVHLSQPAISRSIQALEEELGVTLFDRSGHRAQLTANGRSIVAHARQLISEENELQREVALMRTGDSGEVLLGASPTPASICLRHCLTALACKSPKTRVNVSLGRTPELLEKLRAEKLDLALVDTTDIANHAGLHIEPLARLQGDFLCRKEHPLLKKKQRSFHDTLNYPIACSAVSDEFSRQFVSQFGPEAHANSMITYRCDSYEIQKMVVLNSDTILLSMLSTVRQEIERDEIVPLGIIPETIKGNYSAVRLSGRMSWPTLERLMTEIRQSFCM